jgi:YbbR domain-containing protein
MGLGFLLDNLLYKSVALFVAVILWIATQGFRSVEGSLNLPISLESYDRAAVVVVEQSAQEVNLRLVGSQAALRRAEQQLKRYPVSLAQVQSGELRLGVDPEQLALPRGARVAAWSPSNLALRIEPVERRSVPVRVDLSGEVPAGFRIVSVEVTPRELRLAGARSSISRVRAVLTERIDVAGLQETKRFEVQVLMGRPHVWREEPDSEPLAVVVTVAPTKEPEPPDTPDPRLEREQGQRARLALPEGVHGGA